MADIKFTVLVDSATGQAQIKEFEGKVDVLGKTGEASGGKFAGMWKQVASGEAVYNLVKKAGDKFLGFLKDCIKSAGESETADRALEAALELTGRRYTAMGENLRRFAFEQQRQTTFNDEAIKGAATLLVQLTNLDQNGIERAIKGSMGLASVMGIDLQSAAMMVAKAMEGNYATLGRYGIKIKETGDAEKDRAALLDKLGAMYGRATSETDTYSGKMKLLKNAYDEIKESAGRLITENESLFNGVIKITNGIVDFLNKEQMLRVATLGAAEAENSLTDRLSKAAVAAGFHYGQMGKLIEAYGGNVTALTMAIIKGKEGKEIQEALAKVGKEEAIVLAKKAEEYKKLEKGTNTSSDATKKATKTERDYLDVLKDLNVVTEKMATKTIILDMATLNTAFRTGKIDADAYKAGMDILQAKLRDIGADAAGVVVPAARHMGMIWSQVSDKMAREAVYVKKTWAQNVQEMAQHWQEKMQQIVATTTQITGQISAINQQALTNKLQAIDNAYNKEKLAIVNSLKTEQEKADALKVLDAKFEAQRASAQRNYAKAQKAVALANAIVNTAEGVSKALASAPPPWNIALAAITGALGAIQIGLIARQPLPLARGAIFKRPTILTADSGSQYEVGDGGEPEVLSGPKQLRQAIFGERGEQQTGMRRTVHNHFHLYIGMEEIKEQVIKIVEEADALGQLTLRKAFA